MRSISRRGIAVRGRVLRPLRLARRAARESLRRGRRKASSQFLILASIVVGLVAGTAAIVLKTTVHGLHELVADHGVRSIGLFALLLAPPAGLVLTALASRYLFQREKEKGIPGILSALPGRGGRIERTKTFSYLVRSVLTVGSGGSLGLETPIVVTGSALGSHLGAAFRLAPRKRSVLLASGAAAGIAAVFNAPVAGVMFAAEVLLADVALADLVPVLIAAVSGALCSRIALREDILFFFRLGQRFDYGNVPWYVVLGILSGPVSLFFSRTVARAQGYARRIHDPLLKAVLGGIALGAMCMLFPALFGEGYGSVKALADGDPWGILADGPLQAARGPAWMLVVVLWTVLGLKAVASAITHAAGGFGGNFAPSLFVGAFCGAAFAHTAELLPGVVLPESNFALVGMAGILSGVMRAPLTAIFLIAEITGGYELMIPLMIVSSFSFLIVRQASPAPARRPASVS